MSHASEFDLVSFGEAMVEFNQTDKTQPRHYLQGFGGDSSNLAIAAARQGARVAYLSALGNDTYGANLRELWDLENVDHSHVSTHENAPTGLYFVTHAQTGHHFHFARAGSAASLFRADAAAHALVKSARAFHFSGISIAISNAACDAAFALADTARQSGVLVSFDTNLRRKLWSLERARALTREAIAACDICLPSYDDMVALIDETEQHKIVDHCLQLGAKIVALKCGERGALVATQRERHTIEPFPCNAVDATGAGDTFGGAFLARHLAGDSVQTAARYAACAAALSTQGFGAVEPIPYAAAVRAALQ